MTNEELQKIYVKADMQYDALKDTIHHLAEENKQLKAKSEVLEENNKLLIQQKAQMYKDLDIAYERIDKAIEYIKKEKDWYKNTDYKLLKTNMLLQILGDKENE